MWPIFKRHSMQMIAVHDGHVWHAHIFAWKRRNWISTETIESDDNNASTLPKELLDFACDNLVRRVRVLIPGDIHAMELQLPEDAEPEEIHAAMTFEVADEIGMEAHLVRVAVAKSETYRMGGRKNLLITASFDEGKVQSFYDKCSSHDLRFDGLGALEMAILHSHSCTSPDSRLLLVGSRNSFYVTPEIDNSPFTVQRLAFGLEHLETLDFSDESLNHAKRTLQRLDIPLNVWYASQLTENVKSKIQELLSGQARYDFIFFESRLPGIAAHLASHDLVGTVNDGCSLVGIEERNLSPYRAGTWIFCMILLLTVSYVGSKWYSLRHNMHTAENKIAAWKVVKDERSRLQNQLKQLTATQKRSSSMEELMQLPVLPRGIIRLLETLSNSMPPFTCVTTIQQISDSRYRIYGQTDYQEGLIELNEALSNAMAKDGLRFEPEAVSQETNSAGREFVGQILPKAEQR